MSKFFNLDSPLMNGLNKLADLMLLNIITIVCCLPVITIGASLTAMNYVALKIVRNEESYIFKAFFKSFKQNFKQATIMWLIFMLIIAVYVVDFVFVFLSGMEFPNWSRIGVVAVAALTVALLLYSFPLLAKFDNTIGRTIKNSVLVSLYIWPKTLLMLVIWAIPVAIVVFLPQILPIPILIGVSGPGYLCALLYNKAFKKFEPQQEEEEADNWFIEPLEEEKDAAIDEEADVKAVEEISEEVVEKADEEVGETVDTTTDES